MRGRAVFVFPGVGRLFGFSKESGIGVQLDVLADGTDRSIRGVGVKGGWVAG